MARIVGSFGASSLPVVVGFLAVDLRNHMGDADDAAFHGAASLLRRRVLFRLGELLEQVVSILLGKFQSLLLVAGGFVRKIFLIGL